MYKRQDLGLNYRFPKTERHGFTESIRLNVGNLFNKYYINSSTIGEHRSLYATYTLSH